MSRKGKAPGARGQAPQDADATTATPGAAAPAIPAPPTNGGRRIVLALLLAVIAAAAWFGVQRLRADGPPLPAEGSIDDAVLDAEIRRFADAVTATPSDAEAWARLAMTYHVHELFTEADACYARSLAIDPSQTQRRWLRALVLDAQGRTGDALGEARRVFDEEPQYAPARAVVARWHLARGDLGAAMAEARKAVDLAPESASERVVLAQVLVERGEFAEAETVARGALPLTFERPQNAAFAHFVLGRALRGLGRAEEAAMETARGRDSDGRVHVVDPWTFELGAYQKGFRNLLYAANDAVRSGRPGDALPYLFDLQRRDPGHLQVALDLGRALRELNRLDESYDTVSRALEKHPGEVALLVEAALTAERAGDDERALEHADAAVAAKRSPGEALETRGMIHYRRGRWAEARRDFDAAFAADPSRPWVLVHAGMTRLETDDPAGARDYFTRCIAADPGIADAYAGLAIVSVLDGSLAAAEHHLATSRHLEPRGTPLQTAADAEIAAAKAKPPR